MVDKSDSFLEHIYPFGAKFIKFEITADKFLINCEKCKSKNLFYTGRFECSGAALNRCTCGYNVIDYADLFGKFNFSCVFSKHV